MAARPLIPAQSAPADAPPVGHNGGVSLATPTQEAAPAWRRGLESRVAKDRRVSLNQL
jgi:hypothetical protein